jgi:type VI secretion system protein VasI
MKTASRTAVAAVIILLALTTSARTQVAGAEGAQPPKASLARCLALTSDLARLACYDGIAKGESGEPPKDQPAPAPPDTGTWKITETTNPIDDTKTVMVQARDADGKSFIALRCRQSGLEVMFYSKTYLGRESMTVTSRVGDQPPVNQRWSASTDGRGLFYPGNHKAFVRTLVVANKLAVQVTPYSSSPAVSIFDLTGLEQALVPLKTICGLAW